MYMHRYMIYTSYRYEQKVFTRVANYQFPSSSQISPSGNCQGNHRQAPQPTSGAPLPGTGVHRKPTEDTAKNMLFVHKLYMCIYMYIYI